MRLTRLATQGFRNLVDPVLEIDADFVVISGENAQGKTNLLEAIYLLATLKPLRGRRVRELVAWGSTEAQVVGQLQAQGLQQRYRVTLGAGGRVAKVDDQHTTLQHYFRDIRAIAFTPDDARIVSGEPGFRRRWLDRATFTAWPAHLDQVRSYRRCLDQKSAVLRSDQPELALLDVIDEQLAQHGARVIGRRVALLNELMPHIITAHGVVSGDGAAVSVRYRSRVSGDSEAERVASLRELLGTARSKELQRRSTLVGPQLDDIVLKIAGRPCRTYGSRGQVRTVVLALKLAEMVAARARDQLPLFLLDDLSSELDRGRTKRLIGALVQLGAQVFATTTDADHLALLPGDRTKLIKISEGKLLS